MKKQTIFSDPTIGLWVITTIVFGIAGYYFETGLPPILMMLIGIVIGLLLNIFFNFIFKAFGLVVNKIPLSLNTAILGTLVTLYLVKPMVFRWPNQVFYPAIIFGIFFSLLAFDSFKIILSKSTTPKTIAWLSIISTFIFFIGGIYWLAQPGNDPYTKKLPLPFSNSAIPTLSSAGVESPVEYGTYKINKFTYGSGTDDKRKEYRTDIKYKTPTIDASRLLPEWKEKDSSPEFISGIKWREWYWGFGVKNFPLNGRVYMPEGDGPFPLILMVHGNHSMVDYSDDGYSYLGELLASRGIAAVSVDENFINAHWSGDFRGKEMPVRAWLLLKHLEQWKKWNNFPDHELFNKIDMGNILLIGHSRGGEAVSIAAAFNKLNYFPDNAMEFFDFNFNIKGIVSIAPTDYRYHRKINLENINFLSLQGSYDSDETSFWGMRPYRRLTFTDSSEYFKAGVYIHRANHGQFNSGWGRTDFGGPIKWLLNTAPLITGEDQRLAAQIFISAFAEAVLKKNKTYLPIFKNAVLGKDWLPENYYLTHYKSTDFKLIADFEEDIELTSAPNHISVKTNNFKIWREEKLQTRDGGSQDNNAVVLGWDYGEKINEDSLAVYSISIPDSFSINIDSTGEFLISLAIGNLKELEKSKKKKNKIKPKIREEPTLDFTMLFADKKGETAKIPISQIKKIAPMLKSNFTKIKSIDKDIVGDEWEIQLDGFHIPVNFLKEINQNLDVQHLQKIELIFDRSEYGVVVVDDIGFTEKQN